MSVTVARYTLPAVEGAVQPAEAEVALLAGAAGVPWRALALLHRGGALSADRRLRANLQHEVVQPGKEDAGLEFRRLAQVCFQVTPLGTRRKQQNLYVHLHEQMLKPTNSSSQLSKTTRYP